MYKALDNSLFMKDQERYETVRKRAVAFNSNYTGSNIIQDDIFHIIENYVLLHDMHFELFRFPLGDLDFCACTFIRNDRVFVVINSAMPLCKQIFAAAHEFYHLYNYFEDYDPEYQEHSSILDSATMDEDTSRIEDMEANAFAGLILAPTRSISEQIDIFHIDRDNIGIKQLLVLMEIYAIPYKAMILRLFEDKIIHEDDARGLFRCSESEIIRQCDLTGRAKRWLKTSEMDVEFGSLTENMRRVSQLDAVDTERYEHDTERIQKIISTLLSGKEGK